MYWQPADEINHKILKSIEKHQTNVNSDDLVYDISDCQELTDSKLFLTDSDFSVEISGCYDPLLLIQSNLLYSVFFFFICINIFFI